MADHYKVLYRVADQMSSWDNILTLAIFLGVEPREVNRLQNEKNGIREAGFKILGSCYRRNAVNDVWKNIQDVLVQMNKNCMVFDLGIDQLISPEIDPEEFRNENVCLNV